ncbi:hypothetical protein GLS40_00120 [Pseudooceanicola sp. 216_PA32_1]|uniref:Lipoprotein n=1 Tax=Pseudooceanicola pacificus TaxID=2676438 RepID=A0A844WCL2_9RHOB|nr:hypothetical protein [Pseudooceanicola pacificus]MWB76419.1 hypothetical protein [Pseudooceanicola pacificus]
MTIGTYLPIARLRAALAAGVALTALTACDDVPISIERSAQETQYVAIPASQLWFSVPQVAVAMERRIPGGREQRAGLRNATTLAGDNYLLMQAMPRTTRLQFEKLEERIGGFPAPFTDLDAGTMRSTTDSGGQYFWADYRAGADTICVLGIRRVDSSTRQMPAGLRAVDVMLRNCVRGTAEEALVPLKELGMRRVGGTVSGDSGNNNLMLSPLAAPTP